MDVLLRNVEVLTSMKKGDHMSAFKNIKELEKIKGNELGAVDYVRIKLTKGLIFMLTEE